MGITLPEWFTVLTTTYLIPFIINVVLAALILIIGFALVKALLRFVKKFTSKLDVNIQTFIENFVGIALKLVVILTAVIVIGVPESSVIAVLGSCGLAIGLALQGGLSNIASGIIIMFCKPFHVGDFIISGGISGVVKDIGIYYTLITTPDNQDISVPNSTLANSTITNLSTESTRRLDFDFTVSYEADLDLTRKVLLASAQMNDLVLKDPAPEVLITAHGASGVTVKLRVWCAAENYWTVNFDMWEDVKKAFDKFGIEIPYQYVNVVMKDKK
ncbi:MAG: mechanosensitive ion channel family protein [Clostridia bacterium]|nr:mechanosensitive ion channel family protein [Clostridia bacterium]MBQ9996619.1 mechanosensitive ion channel family protein [Clostridia bacterium]